jgi:hypothetical protein
MKHSHTIVAAFLVVSTCLFCAMPHVAQAGDYFETPRKGFHFSPAPGSVCNSFLITEMTLLYRVGRAESKPSMYDFRSSDASNNMMSWQIGYMGNTSDHDSWGVAFNFALGDDRSRFGVGPAYRRWFRHRSFFDASAGILLAGQEDDYNVQGMPLYAQVGLGISSMLSVVGRVEHIRFKDPRVYLPGGMAAGEWSSTFYHVGINVGGEQGAILCGISACAITLVVLSSLGHDRISESPIRY